MGLEIVRRISWRTLESLPPDKLPVTNTQAHQEFLGPTALGIFHNYTVSFGAQFPIYQDVGSAFPKEHVRFAVNFSYLLFQHAHSNWDREMRRTLALLSTVLILAVSASAQ